MQPYFRRALVGICLCWLTAIAAAQPPGLSHTTPEQRARALTEMMARTLVLDEKNRAAVAAVNLEFAQKTQLLMESSGPQVQKLAAFKKNALAKDARLKTLLTPRQYSEYLEKKSEIEALGAQRLQERLESTHQMP